MPRNTLQQGDIIFHETFDARARITNVGDGEVDLEWLSGDLEDRTWPNTSLSALNRGIGETIEIVDAGPETDDEVGSDEGETEEMEPSTQGKWITRTIPCPDCTRFTKSGHDTVGFPYAKCSNCGWEGDSDYLVQEGYYVLEMG